MSKKATQIKCRKCLIIKLRDEFNILTRDRLSHICKICYEEREYKKSHRYDGNKVCNCCKEAKPIKEFHKSETDFRILVKCKECRTIVLLENNKKKCVICKNIKHFSEFPTGNKNKCQDCFRKIYLPQQKTYYKKTASIRIEKSKSYRKENYTKVLFGRIKNRSMKKNIPFNLEVQDIGNFPEKCPVFDIKLEVGEGRPTSNSPSIDKVDNSKGYVKGNIKIISNRANSIKSDGTIQEHEKIIQYMKDNLFGQEDYCI